MRMVYPGTAAPPKTQPGGGERLERVFSAVDAIKDDLVSCGRNLQLLFSPSDVLPFSYGETGFKVYTADEKGNLRYVRYQWDADQKTLSRIVNTQPPQLLLENVTLFRIRFFLDQQMAMYQLDQGNAERVRGYIYLPHLNDMQNKEDQYGRTNQRA